MPLYRFDILVEDRYPDGHATKHADLDAALAYASEIAATHLNEMERGAPHRIVRVTIRDENGGSIQSISRIVDGNDEDDLASGATA